MTDIWLETFLGKIGKYILAFLSRYYYFIIPVVLIYGIFLTLKSLVPATHRSDAPEI